MHPTAPCTFCEIAASRAPASLVYEDERAIAFMDIGQVTPGHLLVVPRRHATGLADLDEPTGQHLFVVAMRMAVALRRSGLRCEGINIFLADGAAAGQDVFHVHLHVVPRFSGDGFILDADWASRPDRAELDRLAAQIRRAYASDSPSTDR
jgi:diadenosine tetraphosphate (Ap4A) HIT family hydrolase